MSKTLFDNRQMLSAFHWFKCEGDFFLVDIKQQRFFEVNPLVYHLLQMDPPNFLQTTRDLYEHYGKEMVDEGINYLHRMAEGAVELKVPFSEEDIIDCYSRAPVTTVNLLVSYSCNMTCSYCYAGNIVHKSKSSRLMPENVARQAVDCFLTLKQQSEPRKITFKFSGGGEPLLNFEVIRNIIEYASSHPLARVVDVRFKLSTNGINLTEKILRYFQARSVEVKISIDGDRHIHERNRHPKREDGSFAYLLSNINKALEILTPRKVVAAITYTDTRELPEIFSYVTSLGFRRIKSQGAITRQDYTVMEQEQAYKGVRTLFLTYLHHLHEAVDDGRPMKDYPSFEAVDMYIEGLNRQHYIRHVACFAGIYDCAVSPDGSIYSCNRFAEQPEHRMGHVSRGISEDWRRKFIGKTNIFHRPKCLKCWLVYWCGGECNYRNYITGDSMLEPNKLTCASLKAFFEHAIWFYSRLRNENPALLETIVKRSIF